MAESRFRERAAAADGFSLVEVLVATVLLATAILTVAQLFGIAIRSNMSARSTTSTTLLAQQKLEQLRGLTWGFDSAGLPISDTTTDTALAVQAAAGGTGLAPSPSTALQQNTAGYVDYLDKYGNSLGGGATTPGDAAYIRRWSVEPLPANPNDTLIIQVLVTPHRNRGSADQGAVARMPDEARLVTVRTRKTK